MKNYLRLLTAALLVMSATIGGNAFAQETAQAQEEETFTESHIEAARNVVAITEVLNTFDTILPVLAEQTTNIFVQANPTRAEEIIEVTNNVALSLAGKRSELNLKIYQIWARRFTEQELKQLAEFYKTPLGAKLTKSGPTMSALTIGTAREWQDALSIEMVTLVREELDKRIAAQ